MYRAFWFDLFSQPVHDLCWGHFVLYVDYLGCVDGAVGWRGLYVPGMMALLPGLGLFGTVLATGKRKRLTRKSIAWMSLLGLMLFASLFALGCGSSSSNNNPTPSSQQVTVMVTGTSGSLSQSSAVTVTIN